MSQLRLLPNQVTAMRLALIPFMWWAALANESVVLASLLAVAFISDALDGALARRMGLVTAFGAAFDSLADNLLLPSAACWLVLLRPGIFSENALATGIAAAIYFASLTVGLVKFRKLGGVHLVLSKVSAVTLYVFAVHALVAAEYSRELFWVACICFVASSSSTLIVQLLRPASRQREFQPGEGTV